jgi:hypothetical protein
VPLGADPGAPTFPHVSRDSGEENEMDNKNKNLNRNQSQRQRKSQQSDQSSPQRDESVGRKPGEMDAPHIPDNVKQNFE